METKQRTPGPWKLGSEYTTLQLPGENKVYDSRANLIAKVYAPDGNADGNAALIATAPDLLRECRAMRAVLFLQGYPTPFVDAVIARAEGMTDFPTPPRESAS